MTLHDADGGFGLQQVVLIVLGGLMLLAAFALSTGIL